MTAFLLVLAAALVISGLVWRLLVFIRADGYGSRSASGLPRDWSPTDLPSTSYAAKPHF